MSGNKDVGLFSVYVVSYRYVIFAWIATDMFHHYIALLDLEPQYLTETFAYILAVDVTIHSTYFANAFKSLYYQTIANVTGMPYLITVSKVVCKFLVPPAVGV